jgi:hypothetical protein
MSSEYNRSSSHNSLDKSTTNSTKQEKSTKNCPIYHLLENCYLATWGGLKKSGQNQPCVVFFGTGELLIGYFSIKKQEIVLNGPICMFGPTGAVILCECEDGKLEGVGLNRLANGDIVIGEWHKGFKDGAAVSYNIDSDKKVFANFQKGEVKVLERAAQGSVTHSGSF